MHITTISIDLGASFTKVGFRLGCAPTAGQPFEFEARVLTISGDALIPSLAVKTNQDRLPWLFGQDAADSRRGPGLEFCTNWKKGLYRPDNDAEAVKSAIIAHRFFEWLRINLTPVTDEWSTVRVRVTLPAFGYAAKLEGVVRRCMNLAGWEPYELTFSTEPHANAIGLLTLGRNVVNRGRMSRTVDLGRMLGYGNPYLEQARAVVLRDSHKRILRLAIIDIGAFTTDVARLDFDVAAPEANSDGLTHIQPDSFPVGIHEDLDMAFWNGLAERYGPVNEQLTFREQESLKHALFARRTYGLIVKSHSWIIGGADDQSVVEEVSQQFAEEIWRNIGSLFGSNTADVVFLTGGGSQICLLYTSDAADE